MSEDSIPMDRIVVTATHGACGEQVRAFPAVVINADTVVVLNGGIGVNMPGNGHERGTAGLLYECLDDACQDNDWTFAPYDLEELVFAGVEMDDESERDMAFFTAEVAV